MAGAFPFSLFLLHFPFPFLGVGYKLALALYTFYYIAITFSPSSETFIDGGLSLASADDFIILQLRHRLESPNIYPNTIIKFMILFSYSLVSA
jgi:hypothetical protein